MAFAKRCTHAARFDSTWATRCFLDDGHASAHRGRSRQGDVDMLTWQSGSNAEFVTDRTDAWAWEIPNHRRK